MFKLDKTSFNLYFTIMQIFIFSFSQQDLTKNGYSNNVMKPTTSTPNITARSSPMRITSSATMNLTPASPQKARRTTTSSNSSFMKPTTSSAKKLSATPLATPATMKSHNAPGTGNSRTTTITSTRLTATRPSRR